MSSSIFLWIFILSTCLVHCCMADENVKVEEITNATQRSGVGEGPHWSIKKESLYFVDIIAPAIHRLDGASGEIFKASVRSNDHSNISAIGFIVPVDGSDDEFIIGADRKLLRIRWDGESSVADTLQVLAEVDSCCPGNRINDGKADPNGALFFGTMGDESHPDFGKEFEGNFYRYTPETGVKLLHSNIGISNGLSWDTKRQKFFYIDSLARDVKEFNYDSTTSEIANETVLIDFNKSHKGSKFVGDGMTIDENGILYVCAWDGSRVIVIDPTTKKVLREIPIPTNQVTSAAFGGPNLDILYVTTAGKPKPRPAPAGGLFKVTGLGVRGLPMHNVKM